MERLHKLTESHNWLCHRPDTFIPRKYRVSGNFPRIQNSNTATSSPPDEHWQTQPQIRIVSEILQKIKPSRGNYADFANGNQQFI